MDDIGEQNHEFVAVVTDPADYDQVLDELAIAGGTTLEESLALWERGERLATICQEWLDGARRRRDAAIEADPG